MTNNQLDRFLAKVSLLSNGCWEWSGGRSESGYGVFTPSWKPPVKKKMAHRVAYEHFVGEIPSHLESDHLCRNRACVNPTHIEPVSRRVNVRRGAACRESPHWREYSTGHREAIAASKRGRKRPPFSEEWCTKIGESVSGRVHSPETRALMSAHMKGLKRSAEGCEKIKAAAVARGAKQVSERTHCIRGHAYNDINTRYKKDRGGRISRDCRACAAERHLAQRRAEQAA